MFESHGRYGQDLGMLRYGVQDIHWEPASKCRLMCLGNEVCGLVKSDHPPD
jgi:hypothetical protein